jgi:predicted MFS family arabinose efflux permease
VILSPCAWFLKRNFSFVKPVMSSVDSQRQAFYVVFAAFASQMVVTMSNSTLPTIAPKVAESLGLDAALIGYQVSILFGAAMVGTLFGGRFTRRYGACRTMQLSNALCGAGLMLIIVPHPLSIVAGSFVAGYGQGLINSATAHLLVKYTPPGRRNLLFSIKQTGVPFGGMVVALLAPVIAVTFGWRWAVVMVILVIAAVIFLVQRQRSVWDTDRDAEADVKQQKFGGVPLVLSQASLRWVSLTGFLFAAVQRCLLTFTVIYLVAERGYGLIEAGIMLSLIQGGGIAGRLFWGWLADRMHSSITVLLVVAMITVVDSVILMAMQSEWPRLAVYAMFLIFGAATLGWNGVLHAETARVSPPGMASVVAGGSTFFVFAGVLIGPSLFTIVYGFTGVYSTTFSLMVVGAALGGVLLLFARGAAKGHHFDK